MKLKPFKSAAGDAYNRNPSVTISRYKMFTFNKATVKLLGLKPGDHIEFLQDEESKGDWYIRKHTEGYCLRAAHSTTTKGLLFGAAVLYNNFMDSLGIEDTTKSYFFIISKNPIEYDDSTYYAIITKGAKPVAPRKSNK